VNCDEFVELVTAYLDGALEPTIERRFIEHLAECDGCDTYLEQIRRTVSELGHLPALDLSDGAREQLLIAFRDWTAR